MPARKPRTECCCHSVTVMIAAIVTPAGARNIARIRACLVSERVVVFGDERPGRERRLDLLLVRAAERGEALDLGLDLVMGSSGLCDAIRRTTSAPPGQKPRQGKTPKRASAAPSHDSNARIKHESQSNLSNIVAPRQHKPATDSGILQAYSRFREMATDHRWKRRFRHHRSESGSGPSLHGPDFLYRRKNEARRRKNAQWSGDSQNFFDVRNEPRNEQQVSEPSPKT